jgi:hypothetical protein
VSSLLLCSGAADSVEARVSLLNRQWAFGEMTERHYPAATSFLDAHQQYDIFLDLAVPESPSNFDLGQWKSKFQFSPLS